MTSTQIRQIGTFVASTQIALGTVTPHPFGLFVNNGGDSLFYRWFKP
jgi:hypothetical protein